MTPRCPGRVIIQGSPGLSAASRDVVLLEIVARIVPISRTVGQERIVDEFVYRCTHSIPMDWLLPGVSPTGRRLEIPTVVIVSFEDGKMKSEHLYWDQASALVQLGLLDPTGLPVAGVEAECLAAGGFRIDRVLRPTLPPGDGPVLAELDEQLRGGLASASLPAGPRRRPGRGGRRPRPGR
jgi:hypothetical protein